MEEKRAPNRFLAIIRRLVPLGLIAFLLSQVDWQEVWPLLTQVSWMSLLISALAFLLSQYVIAIRWQYLLRVQGIRLQLPRLAWLVLIGAFASNFLPTTVGGDLVKMAAVAQGQSRRSVAVASVAVDRLFNLAAMFLWLPFAFTLGGASAGLTPSLPMVGMVQVPFMDRIWPRLRRVFQAGRAWFRSPGTVVVALALSWLSIGLSFVSFWIVALALRIPVSFWQASGVAVISYFAALLPVSVNGLGLLEGSVTALLVTQGATYEQGLAAGILIRLVTVAISLIGGARLLWWRSLLAEAAAQELEIPEV